MFEQWLEDINSIFLQWNFTTGKIKIMWSVCQTETVTIMNLKLKPVKIEILKTRIFFEE